MNQTELVHERLKRQRLTALVALRELGIFRLAARIKDLRDQGIEVYDRWIEVDTRMGKTRVKEYWL